MWQHPGSSLKRDALGLFLPYDLFLPAAALAVTLGGWKPHLMGHEPLPALCRLPQKLYR